MKIKVICLNLWVGGKLFDNIKTFIAQENPDILGLQEVYQVEDNPENPWHMVAKFAEILAYPYYAYNPAFSKIEDGKRIQMGNAIFSRFPIKSSISTPFGFPYNGAFTLTKGDYRDVPRNLQHALIDLEGKTLHVFNTQGIWGFDGSDNENRLKMGEIIAAQVAGKQPALLMGDFNAQEGTQSIGKIEQHMISIFKGEMKNSFNMKHKPTNSGYKDAIVDMMFISPDIKVINHTVSSADVSDHVALVAEFEI